MKIIETFFRRESSSGILLILATVLALVCSNSGLSPLYLAFLHLPVEIRIGSLHLDKSLYHWVNDGLMALFFLLIGLEVKREILVGHLSSRAQIVLPGIAAIGGMAVPALIYLAFNHGDPVAVAGWAIPTATDIAFALGVLALLGPRVPPSLKVFLMALAIIDDLGAIVIIAVFYAADLSIVSLSVALACLAVLIALNRFGVVNLTVYFVVGAILWLSVLKSGVHATLAGVVLAFTIPLDAYDGEGRPVSPLRTVEKALHEWVAFAILPLFAFVNAGVDLGGIAPSEMIGPVPLGILLGLFVGKQAGVFLLSASAIRIGIARLPDGCRWRQLYGVSVLTGIGFTMSLFITSLAFEDDATFGYTDKLAILAASFVSGIVGYLVLRAGRSRT